MSKVGRVKYPEYNGLQPKIVPFCVFTLLKWNDPRPKPAPEAAIGADDIISARSVPPAG